MISVKTDDIPAIVIGIRTLANGYKDYDDGGESGYNTSYSYFVPNQYLEAVLVSTNLRRNPFYVLLDEIHERVKV